MVATVLQRRPMEGDRTKWLCLDMCNFLQRLKSEGKKKKKIALMFAPAFARIHFCPSKFKALLAALAAFSHAVEYTSSITQRLMKVKLRKECTHGCSGERCWSFPENSKVMNFLWRFPSLKDILPGIIMVKSSRNSTH